MACLFFVAAQWCAVFEQYYAEKEHIYIPFLHGRRREIRVVVNEFIEGEKWRGYEK